MSIGRGYKRLTIILLSLLLAFFGESSAAALHIEQSIMMDSVLWLISLCVLSMAIQPNNESEEKT